MFTRLHLTTAPMAAVIQAPDGTLHGTTFYGGAYNRGVVFQLRHPGRLRNVDADSPLSAIAGGVLD